MSKKIHCVGILTSGGDCPGLNAAIRGVAKAAMSYGIEVIGFQDGFRGLVENRFRRLTSEEVSGILTLGGTILGTSRDKPHKMPIGNGKIMDMTDIAVANYHKNHLDCLVCLGGGGTQKNALRLMNKGLNIVTLPKTIDNDVAETTTTFGFDTALSIATEAIDRLHTTAESHHRIILIEIMGHNAGWLTLGAGLAGGADVILIPEIPYSLEMVSAALLERTRRGKKFNIVAVAEGAISTEEATKRDEIEKKLDSFNPDKYSPEEYKEKREQLKSDLKNVVKTNVAVHLAPLLEKTTRLEARVTALGHLQRGGSPTSTDRLLATMLGTRALEAILHEQFGIMIAVKNDHCEPVPLEQVAGQTKLVPTDHPQVRSAQLVGTSFGVKQYQL